MQYAIVIITILMKTVTSEDNLSGYFLGDRRTGDVIDIAKLNHKVKSIKSALKQAEKHNEELHLKLKNMKQNHQMQVVHLQTECRKYKQLYDMLNESFQMRGLELKECKKRLKRVEADQIKTAGTQLSLEEAEESTKEYRETIIKQERDLARLREENRALYEQIYQKAGKLKDYEHILSKSYSSIGKVQDRLMKGQVKDKYFLLNLRNALETKNQEFDKIAHEKNQLITGKILLEKQNAELQLKFAKISAELQFQKKGVGDLRERFTKQEKQNERLNTQIKLISNKYSQLLTFSYQLQKDFEKELHSMTKQLTRKDIIKT